MSSGGSAPTSKRIYRWMPEEAASRALGVSVQTVRKSVIAGSLKARVTAFGISQVLVCLNPWVAAGKDGQNVTIESTDSPVGSSPAHPAPRPFAHALAGMHGREKITWIGVVLAFLLLVSLTMHAAKTQAGARNRAGASDPSGLVATVGRRDSVQQSAAGPGRNNPILLGTPSENIALARLQRATAGSTAAPKMQESLAMEDALPPDFQLGGTAPPQFDPGARSEMTFERQADEALDAVPATPFVTAPQTNWRSIGWAAANPGGSNWTGLQTSNLLVGSAPNGWSELILEPGTIPVSKLPDLDIVPFAPLVSASHLIPSTGFHLTLTIPNESGSVGAENPGTSGGVGAEPPQLGDGFSPSPEPGGLALFGLAAGPILLRRRRDVLPV